MKKILLFSIYLLVVLPISAQKSTKPVKMKSSGQEMVPNTVIFKLKPAVRNSIQGNVVTHAGLSKLFKDIQVTDINKMVPNATAPRERQAKSGKDNVDLSTIYVIQYKQNKHLDEVIDLIKKTGLVEYAEPQYLEKLFVIPNDPEAQPGTGKEWALDVIKAYEAWDIEQGDSSVFIGIVDTDTEIENPELINKVVINYNDPINGIDDDNDSYIDNYRGWDIANNDNDVRSKKVLISKITRSSTGADSSYIDTINGNGHSTMVAGCATAEANNGIGLAGTGFNTKFLPIKAMADSSAETGGILKGYNGIVYAADHKCKVINLSWGGGNNYSAYNQDVINYAAINHDVVIVAAAGNDSIEEDFYPASYDNVLSVAASDFKPSTRLNNKYIDVKAYFASYGYHVDLCAPGVKIYSTYKSGYTYDNGSSFSSPYVAGAAALVRSKFPTWSALQVQEQLRVTADVIDTLPENKAYKEKLGKGRLNMFRALTDTLSPSIRMLSNNFPDNITHLAFSGDTIRLIGQFINYLHPSSSLTLTISSPSPYVKILDSTYTVGTVGTLQNFNNQTHPFVFVLGPNMPSDYKLTLRIGYADGAYTDYQYFQGIVNPSYVVIDTNQVALTVTSIGRLGYNDALDNLQGIGFVYKGQNLLFEGGLMATNGPTKVSDCVRGDPQGETDQDFTNVASVRYIPSVIASEQTASIFVDTAIPDKIGLQITQNSYAWHTAPEDKFVVLSYQVKNISGAAIDTLHLGIFADWDVMNENKNKADWDSASKTGYVYNTDLNGLFAGISVLSSQDPSCFSMDHSSNIGGNNIFPNDGFTTLEKYLTLSRGVFRPQAGVSGTGGDVSQVVGASIYHLGNNEVRSIDFAMVAGDNKADLLKSVTAAKNVYEKYNGAITSVFAASETSVPLSVFPNPFTGKVQVQSGEKNVITGFQVLNLVGEVVFSSSQESGQSFTADLGNHPSGMYLVKVTINNKLYTQKIAKQ